MTLRSVRDRLTRSPSLDAWAWVALLLLLIGYTWLFTTLAFDLHTGMRTHKADLGQIAQAVWNSSRGRFVEMTDNGFVATRMTDHVEPILALISPIFWLWRDAQALLLLQVLAVAAGALPLYALARRLLPPASPRPKPLWSALLPLALVGAYLLSPQLQSALLTEFHAAPLVVPLVLWAFWAVAAQRWAQFALAALLTAAVKEEMALLAAGLGVWALWRFFLDNRAQTAVSDGFRWGPAGLALGVTGASLLWFYLATFVIVPAHAVEVYGVAESGYFQRYGALGDSPLDMATSLVRRPGVVWAVASEPARLHYLLQLAGGFGFLSLLAPEVLLLCAPLLLANLLSAYPAQYYGEFHYSAPLIAYTAVSAVYGARRVLRVLHEVAPSAPRVHAMASVLMALWIITCAGVLYVQNGRAPGGGRYDPTPIEAHHRLLPHFVAQIPPDAPVTATAAVHPHVALRRYVYQFPTGLDAPQPATWALLDVTTNTDMAPGDLKARVDQMLASGWGVVDGADGFLLLRRGAEAQEIPDAFYDFARASTAALESNRAAEIPPTLQWLDVRVEDWPRWRQTKIVSTWQAGHESARPWLALRTPDGELLYDYAIATPPALLWYPPERWQPGERVRITTLPLTLPRTWGVAVERATVPAAVTPVIVEDPTSLQLVAGYTRRANGHLRALPLDQFLHPVSDADGGLADDRLASGEKVWGNAAVAHAAATFDVGFAGGAGEEIDLHAALAPATIWPGALLNLHLGWHGARAWPGELRVFVHLRQSGTNQNQRDGAPRWFLYYDVTEQLADESFGNDWRQIRVPAELDTGAEAEPWLVAVGLYDPHTGQRAALVDESGQPLGEELLLGPLPLAPPPVPDQACAMVPSACDAQPLRR